MDRDRILVPAYGRKYGSVDAAKADYLAGVDFKLYNTGQYCSCRDFLGTKMFIYTGDGQVIEVEA
jgi:hypothetical protein